MPGILSDAILPLINRCKSFLDGLFCGKAGKGTMLTVWNKVSTKGKDIKLASDVAAASEIA